MLEKAHVPGHECRSNKTKHLPERKILRHDREDWPQRLIANEAALGSRPNDFVRKKTLGIFGIEAAAGRTLRGLGNRRLQSLSHLQGHQARTIVFFFLEYVGRAQHHTRT